MEADAVAATAKALAVLIVFIMRRDSKPPDELLKFGHDALSQFAEEAMKKMDAQE